MKIKAAVKKAITAVLIFALAFVVAFLQMLYRFDRIFSDPLYQSGSASNSRIKIIAIDEKTIQKYKSCKSAYCCSYRQQHPADPNTDLYLFP